MIFDSRKCYNLFPHYILTILLRFKMGDKCCRLLFWEQSAQLNLENFIQ
jgi:hypothetical protein